MKLVVTFADEETRDRDAVGGKGCALATLAAAGFTVPRTLCVTTEAYRRYLAATGLGERIAMALGRKDFADMRWEEFWDAALRIRNLFLNTPLPSNLREELAGELAPFAGMSVAVRSSAPAEDAVEASFAGLFESFVNVQGIETILDHIRLVWASLWSDRALLYRQELGLRVGESAMGVVVQELVAGERSGVVFGVSPDNPSLAVVEAVWGLNQGLVDGTVEPDRWAVARESGAILTHFTPQREACLSPAGGRVALIPLPTERADAPPLAEREVETVFALVRAGEELFGIPQDMEWTIHGGTLYTLQSRPVTSTGPDSDDLRPWYLSLHRSFDNLGALRRHIEEELLPAMEAEAAQLAAVDTAKLSDGELADAIRDRREARRCWEDAYRRDCIPMAHGIRLFGQVYNDLLRPDTPFAFMDLLVGTEMSAVERNRMLEDLADLVRQQPELREQLRHGIFPDDPEFGEQLAAFTARFGDLGWITGTTADDAPPLAGLIMELASRPPRPVAVSAGELTERIAAFLSRFPPEERRFGENLLELGRAAYRLRDNDNIILGRIDATLHAAIEEARQRISGRWSPDLEGLDIPGPGRIAKRVQPIRPNDAEHAAVGGPRVRVRQLVGQPAGRGIAGGPARVIGHPEDLRSFRAGEVLICDAVDPNMTFVVPLAAAIIERRGGMLIHGAIIAREYGIPCVTGIPGAVERIRTGDAVTVDGYLGIVTVATEG
ncbi:MAG: hypothetical protein ED859_04105 [Desulfuromonadales bacterium]|nr:MAG: hypothetical protein ED859_04105 [Desulfuromonadales bacterium]